MEQLWNDFSFGFFFWLVLIFGALLLIMRKFAWNPVLDALNTREEGITEALALAEKAKLEMENLQADNKEMLKEAREERDALMKEARVIKEKMIADATDEAQTKADKIVAQAQEAIEKEKQAAVAELKDQVGNLSVEIAEKVIRKQLNSKDEQMKLVDGMLNEVTLN